MANSRLERIGTIYSRITGLLRSEALKFENKPIWYEVYQNFPPKYPPKFDRPAPNMEITKVFYPEDSIRAKISKEKSAMIGTVNLQDRKKHSNTQKCIAYFEELKNDYSSDEALEKAIERVISEMPVRGERPNVAASPSIADEFKKSKNVDITSIFKND